ncbi:MAG: PAS domain S-box protein, partial [Candidatus Omnitrophica bacterium]|nr:PAS domain S-box protein [Candidatus Omnitrophota bacterium]
MAPKDESKEKLIEEIKLLQKRIAELEALPEWETTFNSLGDLVCLQDTEYNYIRVNKAFAKIFGKEPDEFIGKKCYEVVHGLTHPWPDCPHKKALDLKKTVTSEFFEPRLGLYLMVTTSPVFKKDGQLAGTVHIVRDITERKRSEEEHGKMLLWQQGVNSLQQSLLTPGPLEGKLKSVTDSIVRIFDADFCRVWLIQPGDLCEKGCVHAEVREGPHICRYRDRCLHLLASSGRYAHIDGKTHRRVPFGCYKIGRIASGEDHKFLTNDVPNDPRVHNREWARELGLVSFAGYQLRVPGRETIGVLALFAKHHILPAEDAMLDGLSSSVALIVQQAVAEKTLWDSEERYRSLYADSRDAIMIVSPDKGFLAGNPAAVKLFACRDEQQFRTCTPADLSPEYQPDGALSSEKAQQMMAMAIERGLHFFEWTHKRMDGTEFPATVLLSRFEAGGKRVLQATVRDISAQKEAEGLLRVQRDISIALSSAANLDAAVKAILEGITEMEGIDCGAIYLADKLDGGFDIIAHKGLSPQFTKHFSRYPADSSRARLISKGEPFYGLRSDIPTGEPEPLEDIHFMALIPLRYRNEVVGVLTLGSHTRDSISINTRHVIETIADRVGTAIVRFRTEEVLAESAREFETVYNSIVDGVIIADTAAEPVKFIRVNTSACAMFGYTETEFLSKGISDIHPREHLAVAARHFSALAKNEETVVPELPCLRKDGSIFYADIVAKSTTYKGKPVLVGFFRDITERKLAEEELRKEKELLEVASISAKVALWNWDLKTGHLDWSGMVDEMLGYEKGEFPRTIQAWVNAIHPEDRPRVEEILNAHLEKKTPYKAEYRIIKKDGTYVWWYDNGKAVWDENGKAYLMAGACVDTTERKRIEDALHSSNALFETLARVS